MNKETIELPDLVGEHVLTGVDEDNQRGGDANVINFTLDGITYTATEDPSDGYRSCLRDIVKSSEPTKNIFPPVAVRCEVSDPSSGSVVLNVFAKHNNKLILSVGTSDNDDYYPSFVASWNPGNMA